MHHAEHWITRVSRLATKEALPRTTFGEFERNGEFTRTRMRVARSNKLVSR